MANGGFSNSGTVALISSGSGPQNRRRRNRCSRKPNARLKVAHRWPRAWPQRQGDPEGQSRKEPAQGQEGRQDAASHHTARGQQDGPGAGHASSGITEPLWPIGGRLRGTLQDCRLWARCRCPDTPVEDALHQHCAVLFPRFWHNLVPQTPDFAENGCVHDDCSSKRQT
jgi:hypothetical protein